jgi:hypothetical protein
MQLAAILSAGLVILPTAGWVQAASSGEKKLEQTLHYALAMRGCTQEDAPALEIYLTETPFDGVGDPSPPYIRIEVSSSPKETIAPTSLTLIQMRRDPTRPGRIARAELVGAGHDSVWLSGTITLKEVSAGGDVSGRYDLTTPAGRLDRSFIAKLSKRTSLCG